MINNYISEAFDLFNVNKCCNGCAFDAVSSAQPSNWLIEANFSSASATLTCASKQGTWL